VSTRWKGKPVLRGTLPGEQPLHDCDELGAVVGEAMAGDREKGRRSPRRQAQLGSLSQPAPTAGRREKYDRTAELPSPGQEYVTYLTPSEYAGRCRVAGADHVTAKGGKEEEINLNGRRRRHPPKDGRGSSRQGAARGALLAARAKPVQVKTAQRGKGQAGHRKHAF